MESFRRRGSLGAATSSAIAALALAAGAQAALPAPTVITGGAQQVSYGSATLTGSVNPRGSSASYYFQYGPTAAYGGQHRDGAQQQRGSHGGPNAYSHLSH